GRSAERRRRRGVGLPVAEVHGQPDQIGGQVRGIHHVVAAEGVHRQVVVRPLRAGDVHEGEQAPDGDACPVVKGRDLDGVVVVGAVDDDGVACAVADADACSATEVEVERRKVGCGQVVDGDGVGAAEGIEVDRLDAVEVHGDVGDIPGEADVVAVGGNVDLF